MCWLVTTLYLEFQSLVFSSSHCIFFWIEISICQTQKYHQIVGRQCCPETSHFPFCIVKYIWANIQKLIFRLSSDWSVLGTQLSNFNISNAVFLQCHLNSEVKLKKSHISEVLWTLSTGNLIKWLKLYLLPKKYIFQKPLKCESSLLFSIFEIAKINESLG